jgi:hypothetical protein
MRFTCRRSRPENFPRFGSHSGSERGAAIYTLIGTAKLNGLDPEAYLRHVIGRIPEHPSIASTSCCHGSSPIGFTTTPPELKAAFNCWYQHAVKNGRGRTVTENEVNCVVRQHTEPQPTLRGPPRLAGAPTARAVSFSNPQRSRGTAHTQRQLPGNDDHSGDHLGRRLTAIAIVQGSGVVGRLLAAFRPFSHRQSRVTDLPAANAYSRPEGAYRDSFISVRTLERSRRMNTPLWCLSVPINRC